MQKISDFFEIAEGVEFEIDGHVNIYVILENKLKYWYERGQEYSEVVKDFNCYINRKIKILPPKKTISEDEKVILRNLPEKYKDGWIARDNYKDELYIYKNKPNKLSDNNWGATREVSDINIFSHLFKCITSEDEEPTSIKDLLDETI